LIYFEGGAAKLVLIKLPNFPRPGWHLWTNTRTSQLFCVGLSESSFDLLAQAARAANNPTTTIGSQANKWTRSNKKHAC